MSEGVLRRWSRRKQAARAEPGLGAPAAPETVHPPGLAAPEPPPPELPALDSLGAGSDYTAFLRTGVTAAVQQLALRRAWESDERIAGFRGMAEYAWDFNAPSYGRLWPTDDVGQLLRAVLEPPAEEPPAEGPVAAVEPAVADVPDAGPDARPDLLASGQAEPGLPSETEASPATGGIRRHGSALPC